MAMRQQQRFHSRGEDEVQEDEGSLYAHDEFSRQGQRLLGNFIQGKLEEDGLAKGPQASISAPSLLSESEEKEVTDVLDASWKKLDKDSRLQRMIQKFKDKISLKTVITKVTDMFADGMSFSKVATALYFAYRILSGAAEALLSVIIAIVNYIRTTVYNWIVSIGGWLGFSRSKGDSTDLLSNDDDRPIQLHLRTEPVSHSHNDS